MSHLRLDGDRSGRLATFAALGSAQALVYLALAAWPGPSPPPTAAMLLCVLAFSLYVAALAIGQPLAGRRAFIASAVLGLLFRAILIPEPPSLSDDYFRYLWDGLVQVRGINPYRYAPVDPAVAGIDEALRGRINHPQVSTIYPPLAQLSFLLTAVFSGDWLVLKALWLICDLGVASLLFTMLPRARRLAAWTLYWWSPLVVVEVAWNAHLDLLGVLPLLAALWLGHAGPRAIRNDAPGGAAAAPWPKVLARSAGVGLALAGAALVKYFPAALLPAATRRIGHFCAAAFLLATAALYLPHLGAGPRLFEGLFTYSASWRFNDGLFAIVAWGVGSERAAKAVAAAVVLAIVVQSVRNDWSLSRTAFWVTGTLIVLSPTVHPWYLLWMVPLVALRPSRAWLYLSGSVFLAYYGLATYRDMGVWPEPWWLRLVIYGPFFALLVVDGWRGSWWQSAWQALTPGSESRPSAAPRSR